MLKLKKEEIKMDWPKCAHLSPGFIVGDFIFTSGNVGRDPITGKTDRTIRGRARTINRTSLLIANSEV